MNPDAIISLVIITYNRPDDLLYLLRNISSMNRLDLVQEVIIVNNHSSVPYTTAEQFISENPAIPFRYIVSEENLGVSRGRNFAISQSAAPVLVFLDDDAYFKNRDAFQQLHQLFTEQEQERPLGIAALKVFYEATGEMQQTAFPHKDFEERKDLHRFDTYYFAGCAHAIRRELLERSGLYPENFFYGMEEYDLSYRALDKGFRIVYDDRVVVIHKESPEGRLTNREKLRGMWVNKTKVAWKYLPMPYFLSTAFMWSLQYLRKTGFHLAGWIRGWLEVAAIPSAEQRRPVKDETMGYLRRVKARMWY